MCGLVKYQPAKKVLTLNIERWELTDDVINQLYLLIKKTRFKSPLFSEDWEPINETAPIPQAEGPLKELIWLLAMKKANYPKSV